MITKVRKSTLDLAGLPTTLPVGGTTNQVIIKQSGTDFDTAWGDAKSLPNVHDGERVSIPSATTVNLTGLSSQTRNISITGTTEIDGFQMSSGQIFAVRFAGVLVLKNNGNIVTQTGADINTVAGATCFIRAFADNTVEVLSYVA